LAESEYEKYQVSQDCILESDFDREVKKLLNYKFPLSISAVIIHTP